MAIPPPKYFRLRPGGEVRLRYACIIKCDEVVKDAGGLVAELRCSADLDSRKGGPNAERKIKGTIHWVSAARCVEAETRLYDRLFTVAEPDKDGNFQAHLNRHSLETVAAKLESSLGAARPGQAYQFERLGYFVLDAAASPTGETRLQPDHHPPRRSGRPRPRGLARRSPRLVPTSPGRNKASSRSTWKAFSYPRSGSQWPSGPAWAGGLRRTTRDEPDYDKLMRVPARDPQAEGHHAFQDPGSHRRPGARCRGPRSSSRPSGMSTAWSSSSPTPSSSLRRR